MPIDVNDLYVVYSAPYGSYDTEIPDVLYTEDEAKAEMLISNARPAEFGVKLVYKMCSFYQRIDDIKRAAAEEAMQNMEHSSGMQP